MLLLTSSPPCGVNGAPIIVRQWLSGYDPDCIDVVCDRVDYEGYRASAGTTFPPYRYTPVANWKFVRLRPGRLFGPLFATLNNFRLFPFLKLGRRLIRERDIKVLFTSTSYCEFNIAAYLLHREFGIPLYLFESDDWYFANDVGLPRLLVRLFRKKILRAAARVWMTSPAMIRDYESRFGVRGEFLFHHVNWRPYSEAAERTPLPGPPHPIQLVHIGSINHMSRDTLCVICGWINRGLTVRGRQVRLTFYGPYCPAELLGPNVNSAGFIAAEQLPAALATAHVLLIGVSFSKDRRTSSMVRTSLYTKTVDCLASTRPVLLVSPRYTSEVDYFGGVVHLVDTLTVRAVEAAIDKLVHDEGYRAALARGGLELVQRCHSPESLGHTFLRHFRVS